MLSQPEIQFSLRPSSSPSPSSPSSFHLSPRLRGSCSFDRRSPLLFPFIFQSQPLSLEFASLFGVRLCFHVSSRQSLPFRTNVTRHLGILRENSSPLSHVSPFFVFRSWIEITRHLRPAHLEGALTFSFLPRSSEFRSLGLFLDDSRDDLQGGTAFTSRVNHMAASRAEITYVCIYRTQMQSETLTKVKTSGRFSLLLRSEDSTARLLFLSACSTIGDLRPLGR